MKIRITLKLSDAKIEQLALSKGYSPMIWESVNTQSSSDYLRQVYEGILLADLANEYLKSHRQSVSSSISQAEATVRDAAIADIESAVV